MLIKGRRIATTSSETMSMSYGDVRIKSSIMLQVSFPFLRAREAVDHRVRDTFWGQIPYLERARNESTKISNNVRDNFDLD